MHLSAKMSGIYVTIWNTLQIISGYLSVFCRVFEVVASTHWTKSLLLHLLLHGWLLAPSSMSLLSFGIVLVCLYSVNFAAVLTVPFCSFVDFFTGT